MSDNPKLEESKASIDLGLNGEPVRYKGACHCRKIQFEFDHSEIKEVRQCNCSICTQKGPLFVYAPGAKFHFTAGSFEDMTLYQFNKRMLNHYFCPVCGCSTFGTAAGGKVVGINTRSLENFDLKKMNIQFFDGASM